MVSFFKPEEFACPCCGENNINPLLVEKLNAARCRFGKPIVITSGFRCKAHNETVGGSPTSSHLKGLAVDIACDNSLDRFELLSALLGVGFQRIGVAKTFIHVDLDLTKSHRVAWLY